MLRVTGAVILSALALSSSAASQVPPAVDVGSVEMPILTQERLLPQYGVFEVTGYLPNCEELDSKTLAGTMAWDRAEGKQRLEVSYENPGQLMYKGFSDMVLLDDGERQVTLFTPSRSALIRPSRGALSAPLTPSSWLLPPNGKPLRELLAGDARYELVPLDGGDVRLLVEIPTSAEPVKVEFTLSKRLGYAITSWTCPQWRRSGTIDYQVTESGEIRLTGARLLRGDTRGPLKDSEWALKVVTVSSSPRPESEFRVELPVGTLITDYVASSDPKKPRGFTVEEGGKLREEVVAPGFPAPGPKSGGSGPLKGASGTGVDAIVACTVIGVRLWCVRS
jgi:hypothetical protein